MRAEDLQEWVSVLQSGKEAFLKGPASASTAFLPGMGTEPVLVVYMESSRLSAPN